MITIIAAIESNLLAVIWIVWKTKMIYIVLRTDHLDICQQGSRLYNTPVNKIEHNKSTG